MNKPVIEKELLGIYWAITYFRPYLFGQNFFVYTDHRPLISLFNHKNPSSKLTRIRTDLCDYNFEIIYKPGKYNSNADALSRIKIDSDVLKTMIPLEDVKIMTRSKTKMNENNQHKCEKSVENSPTSNHHLFSWQCTSVSDVRRVKILKFIFEKTNYNEVEIRIAKEVLCTVKQSTEHFNVIDIFNKLTTEVSKKHIYELSLRTNDSIFSKLHINSFKKKFNDFQYNKILEGENPKTKILIFTPPTIITSVDRKNQILKDFHNNPISGHSGIKRTICKIKQRYCWKNLRTDVKKYINSCQICKQNKITTHTKEKLCITETPNSSFQIISMDTVGPLIPFENYRYILTIQCELSKYVVAIPIDSKDANTVSKAFVDNFILQYETFKTLKTDRGTEFVNELFDKITTFLKIDHSKSTPFHHESLGSVERNHRVLNEYLTIFTENHSWKEWIPYFVFAYNTTPHTDTGYSPYELVFSKIARLPLDEDNCTTESIYNFDDYYSELKQRLQVSHSKAKKFLEIAKFKRKDHYDKSSKPINIKNNDLVYLRKEDKRKFDKPYQGPFEIIDQNDVKN